MCAMKSMHGGFLSDPLYGYSFPTAEMVDKEAEQQTSATHLAASEIEKLTVERTKVENELDIQVTRLVCV